MPNVVLVARFRAADAEKAEKVKEHLEKIRDFALGGGEPGTLLYYPTRDNADPLTFIIFEEYKSQEDMDKHMASAVFGEFAKATPELIEGGLKSATLSKCTRF